MARTTAARGGHRSQRRQRGARQRLLIDRAPGRWTPVDGQRDGQRLSLGLGQRRGHRRREIVEQIRQPGEREIAVGLAGGARENVAAAAPGAGDGIAPQRGLPDPGRALEGDPDRAGRHTGKQSLDLRPFWLSPEHPAPIHGSDTSFEQLYPYKSAVCPIYIASATP